MFSDTLSLRVRKYQKSNTFMEDEKECKGLGRDQHMYKTEVGMIWGDNIETELKE